MNVKTTFRLAMASVLALTLSWSSCSKDDNGSSSGESNPCGSSTICFEVDGNQYNFDVSWVRLETQNRTSIYFSNDQGGGRNERLNLEFTDTEGLQTGEYLFEENIIRSGGARFEYYFNDGQGNLKTYTCNEGVLNVRSIKDNKITVRFSCSGEDNERTKVQITNGHAFETPRF